MKYLKIDLELLSEQQIIELTNAVNEIVIVMKTYEENIEELSSALWHLRAYGQDFLPENLK